jgi:hypothetical protein
VGGCLAGCWRVAGGLLEEATGGRAWPSQFARQGACLRSRPAGEPATAAAHRLAARTGRPSAGRERAGAVWPPSLLVCPGRQLCAQPPPMPSVVSVGTGVGALDACGLARRRQTSLARPHHALPASQTASLPIAAPIFAAAASRRPRVLRHSSPSQSRAIRPGPLLTTTAACSRVCAHLQRPAPCRGSRAHAAQRCALRVRCLHTARRPAGPTASQTTMRSMTAHREPQFESENSRSLALLVRPASMQQRQVAARVTPAARGASREHPLLQPRT